VSRHRRGFHGRSIFKLTVGELRSIPDRYLGFLLASSHCCNELAALVPFVVFEQDLAEAGSHTVESAFIRSRVFTVDRVLVSKIIEYGTLCSEFLDEVECDPLLVKIAKDYEPLSKEIKSAKWARILRNKVSFHYDQEHVLKTLEGWKDDEKLQFTAGFEMRGATLFDFVDNLISHHMLEYAGGGDAKAGIEVVNTFIIRLIFLIVDFHAQATTDIFIHNGVMLDYEKGELRSEYCARVGEVYIPLVSLSLPDIELS
jgi:hypothetical protein